jgi:transposase
MNPEARILLPEALDDYITETNPVRVVDVFVDELDLRELGFEGVEPAATGRPAARGGSARRMIVIMMVTHRELYCYYYISMR